MPGDAAVARQHQLRGYALPRDDHSLDGDERHHHFGDFGEKRCGAGSATHCRMCLLRSAAGGAGCRASERGPVCAARLSRAVPVAIPCRDDGAIYSDGARPICRRLAWPEATDDFCRRGRGRSDADRMPQQ